MKRINLWTTSTAACVLLISGMAGPAMAQQTQALDAETLAKRLSASQQDGNTFVRAKLVISGGAAPQTLQIQIKSRRTAAGSEMLYQILFPKERKGEAVLLKSDGTGSAFTPPDQVRPISAAEMKQPLFGSDITHEDAVENFFSWSGQSLAGTEAVDGVECVILESKPGKGTRSSYGRVRSWIDLRRMVVLRVEKLATSGNVLRRVDTTRVVSDEGRHLPANLLVRQPGKDTSTVMEGSKLRRGVGYTDADFSAAGMQNLKPPSGSAE